MEAHVNILFHLTTPKGFNREKVLTQHKQKSWDILSTYKATLRNNKGHGVNALVNCEHNTLVIRISTATSGLQCKHARTQNNQALENIIFRKASCHSPAMCISNLSKKAKRRQLVIILA